MPIVASRMQLHGFAGCAKAWRSARSATNTPAMGVHSPTISNIPNIAANTWVLAAPADTPPTIEIAPSETKATPATSRINRRPRPGKPWANVE